MSTNTKSFKSILRLTKNPRFSFPSFPCPGKEPSENMGSFTEGGGEWPTMARARQKPHVSEHVFYTEPYVLGHRVSRTGQLLLPKSTRSGCPASTGTFIKAACRERGGQGRRQDLPQQHRGLSPTLAVHTQGHASTTVPSTTSLLVRAGATTEAQGPFCSTSFSNLQPCASSQHCLQNPCTQAAGNLNCT